MVNEIQWTNQKARNVVFWERTRIHNTAHYHYSIHTLPSVRVPSAFNIPPAIILVAIFCRVHMPFSKRLPTWYYLVQKIHCLPLTPAAETKVTSETDQVIIRLLSEVLIIKFCHFTAWARRYKSASFFPNFKYLIELSVIRQTSRSLYCGECKLGSQALEWDSEIVKRLDVSPWDL